eukprot:2703904-Prymnesium_polylepis.1
MAAQDPRTPTARTATTATIVASAPIFLHPFPPCLHYHRCNKRWQQTNVTRFQAPRPEIQVPTLRRANPSLALHERSLAVCKMSARN